jgi:pilus assembly protein FimV
MSMPSAVRALGLGEIRVDSALNEPLSAQIDIVGATRDELIALTAKVANREIFQRYGADRPAFLSSATFKVGLDAHGRPVLNVRSAEAFTDPLINFLVDLRWGNGELIREYSLLLDPAGFSPSARLAAAPIVSAPTSPSPAELPLAPATHHRVVARDTLRGIARRVGTRSESHAQRMMIAIFRANPNAFEGNINRLHLGALLSLPSEEEVTAIDAAAAKHEVRTHMTAWRLEGRPSAPRRVAAIPNAPVAAPAPSAAPAPEANKVSADASATEALRDRVQSLERALDDMNRQLASENAKIQDLKEMTARAAAASPEPVTPQATAAPAEPVTRQATAAPTESVTPQAPIAPAESMIALAVAAPAEPAPGDPAVRAEIMHADLPAPILAAVVPTPAHPMTSMAVLGPMAGALALLLAGFAFLRRRLAPNRAQQTAAPEREFHGDTLNTAYRETTPEAPQAAHEISAPPVSVAVAKPTPAAPAAPVAAAVREIPERSATDETTQSLAIDAEALEKSYLDMGIDSLGIDTVVFEPGALDTGVHRQFQEAADTATHDTAALGTVVIDTSELDTAISRPDLNTAVMDATKLEPAAVNSTVLDYNLLDLDATAQHVHMPSELNDHVVVKERRTNIVDVLKAAIDRDPHRRDLRMKLLETYYSAASTNQRAFLDVVKKLGREREFLTPDDWKKVIMMGREIAGDDILFAETPKDDLANCA